MTKLTKANKRWIDRNYEKVQILFDNGLSKDEVGLISRYIGSISYDNRYYCPKCGDMYSLKLHKYIKRTKQRIECHIDRDIRAEVTWLIDDLVTTLQIEEQYGLNALKINDFVDSDLDMVD